MPRVLSTEEFDTWEKLLPKAYQERIGKLIAQLKKTSDVGKPLGYPFFKEKKLDKYRVYFLVYEDLDTVLLITISDKKTQQETISQIKGKLDFYSETIKKSI
ncbi:MAG TPA: hypothetical protein VI934_02150 [Candidatus Nanoarchaeia archaeon]|nr:hypothetical protein [Candidatus Nanoarchaeia archaeon]